MAVRTASSHAGRARRQSRGGWQRQPHCQLPLPLRDQDPRGELERSRARRPEPSLDLLLTANRSLSHANRVSDCSLPRSGETVFGLPETEGPELPLKRSFFPAEIASRLCAPQNRGYSSNHGKSRLAWDCVVGLGGLEPPTRQL